MTYDDKETGMATTVKDLDARVAELTAELAKLRVESHAEPAKQPGTAEGAIPRRSDFGYLMLGALLGRPGESPLPIVEARRDKAGTITFTFGDEKHRGTYVELRSNVAGPPEGEQVEIKGDKARPKDIPTSAPIDSVLILNKRDGHIVAVGPKLPAQ